MKGDLATATASQHSLCLWLAWINTRFSVTQVNWQKYLGQYSGKKCLLHNEAGNSEDWEKQEEEEVNLSY